MLTSEFTDEYQDWLDGAEASKLRGRWLDLTLGEMQHGPVLRVSPDATIREVVDRMNAERQTAVLVIERDRLVGIFTERDVLKRVVSCGVDIAHARVRELMTPEPHVLSESTLLSAALRILALGSYHHLPVIDAQGRAKALVSLQSIVTFLVDAFPGEIMNAPPERESFPPANEGA